jgi:hypothetical protein
MASGISPAPLPNTDEPVKDTIDDYMKFSSLREDAKLELQEILEGTRGRKALVVDVQLVGILGQILVEGSKFLKENGVNSLIELRPDSAASIFDSTREVPENIIYLVRPHLPNMKVIAQQIKYLARSGKVFSIFSFICS